MMNSGYDFIIDARFPFTTEMDHFYTLGQTLDIEMPRNQTFSL